MLQPLEDSLEPEALDARIARLEAELARLRQMAARGGSEAAQNPPTPGIDNDQTRALADALPVFVAFIDRDGYYRFVNRAYELWLGRERGAIIGMHVSRLLGEDAYNARRPRIEAALGGQQVRYEAAIRRPDGSLRHTEMEYVPRIRPDGTPDGIYVLASDITERKQAERAQRDSEARLHLALDAGRMAVWEVDLVRQELVGSRELNRLLGFVDDATPTLDDIRARYCPGERERLNAVAAAALARQDRFVEVELRYLHPDGSVRWLMLRAEVHLSHEGLPVRYVGVLLDISSRRAVEANARENEQRLRATYEHAFVGIAEIDPEGRFLRVNEQFCSITGYTREELMGLTCWNVTHPDDLPGDMECFTRQMAGDLDVYILEKRYIHKGGHPVWIALSASKVDNEAGQVSYGIRVVQDITDRRRWEEHQQLLIHELNHRVKNTLATVQSIASQTLRNARSLDEAQPALEARLFALSRAHDVLTRENWEGASLAEIAREALAPYRTERGSRLQVAGPDVRLSPRMALALAMALQELATNAVKYGALSAPAGTVALAWGLEAGPRLWLRWSESGGPPVTPPDRRGFGTRLIERSLAQDLDGSVEIAFAPEGLVCSLTAPLALS